MSPTFTAYWLLHFESPPRFSRKLFILLSWKLARLIQDLGAFWTDRWVSGYFVLRYLLILLGGLSLAMDYMFNIGQYTCA